MAGEAAHELYLWGGGGSSSAPTGIITQTDEQLAELASLGGAPGVGFTWVHVGIGRLGGAFGGGNKSFTGGAAPSGSAYNFQRTIQNSNIVDRCHAVGLKVYLNFDAPHTTAPSSWPIADWWDDSGWTDYCNRLRDLAAFAKFEGFDGISEDWEVFSNSEAWHWDRGTTPHTASAHSESAIRAKVAARGAQKMTAMLEGWDDSDLDLLIYNMFVPDGWHVTLSQLDTGNPNKKKADGWVQWNFIGGLSGVEGYATLRSTDAVLQKGFHQGTAPGLPAKWRNAMLYMTNHLMSLASQDPDANNGLCKGFENWEYASVRWKMLHFAWLDEPPAVYQGWSSFEDKDPPSQVATELAEKRKWGMGPAGGGMIAIFDYSGFSISSSFYGTSYTGPAVTTPGGTPTGTYESGFDYRPALRDASTPGTVDTVDPTLSVPVVGATEVTGTATDDYAIKVVRWADNLGGSGVAQLDWVIDTSGSNGVQADGLVHRELYIQTHHHDWTIDRSDLTPGATSLTITAVDIHDRTRVRTLDLAPGSLEPVNGPVLDLRFDLRNRVTSGPSLIGLNLNWDLRNRVTSGPSLVGLNLNWDTRASVNGSVIDARYDLYRRVTSGPSFIGLRLGWDLGTTVVGPVEDLTWDLRGGVNGGVLDGIWDLRATVSNGASLAWDIPGQATGDQLDLTWDLITSGLVNSLPLRMVADVRAAVNGSVEEAIWDLRSSVAGGVLDLTWDTPAQREAQALDFLWDLRATLDGAEALFLWDLRSLVTGEALDLRWRLFSAVNAGALDLDWIEAGAVDGPEVVLVWDAGGSVEALLLAYWDVLALFPPQVSGLDWFESAIGMTPLSITRD